MPVTYKLNLTMSDGTQIDAGNIEIPDGPPGPTGAQGAPGNVFENFTSLKVDVTDATVSYVSPMAHITGARLIGYGTNNEEIEIDIDIPIVAGDNVTIDASEDNKSIQVSATGGGGGSGKYLHYINVYGNPPFFTIHFQLVSNIQDLTELSVLLNELSNLQLGTSEYSVPATGYWEDESSGAIVSVTNIYSQNGNNLSIEGIPIKEGEYPITVNIASAQIAEKVYPL